MARFPGFFNATQYFGSTNSAKDQQDSFWDQPSVSANHSSGVFNGNAAQPNHFMNNTQEYFLDGWEDWPDDFDDSGIQENELNSFNPGSEKLVVPDCEDSQASSSEEDSPPPGMDPELNSRVEEETPNYGYTSYNSSAASFFDGNFNTQQPGIVTQHDGRSYASVCQTGTTTPPDNSPYLQQPSNSNNYQPDNWSTPTFQYPYAVQEVNPEVADTHENAPTFESWSREPELGSWSPVFNHGDESFANSTQEVPSTVPQPLQVADSNQEPQVNPLRPGEELDAHAPQQQATSSAADFFGRDEGQQDSAWSALTESDPQRAALWGNLPDFHPPSGHVPVENSPFHQDAAAVSQQSSSRLFQATTASKPDQQSSVQQLPGVESPSGVFQTNMPSEQDQQFSLQQYPVMESPSGFFQINSGSEPVINEDNTKGQSMSHLKSITDSMQNDPENLSVAEESLSVQPLHQDPDSVIKQSFSVEQMQPSKQMSSTVANEAFYPSQELGKQMYNPNLFYDQQMKSDPTQEERVASEETHQTKEPHFDELQPRQQPIADPAREVESFVEEPTNLPPSHDSLAFESSPIPQVNELPQEQVFLSTGAISEQEKSGMAQNNLLPGYNMANSEPTQLQEFEITPTKTSEQSAIADDFQNSFDQNNATTDSTQLVPANVSSRGFSGQSMTPDTSYPSDSVQEFFRNENITSESSRPSETPQQFIKPEIPSAPDILQDSFYHDNSSAIPSNPLELKMPSRESSEQSQTPDISLEPDSPGDALQAAFIQKQLAGKAPAASPRTSLWMNGTVLPTPCVLAPAAVVTPVETPRLRENDQAPTCNKQEPPSSVTPTLMQPDIVEKNIPAVVSQQSPPVHPQRTSLPVVVHQPSEELPVSTNPYNQGIVLPSVVNQQIPPVPFAPGPTPPLVHPDSHRAGHPVAVSQQMSPAPYFGGVTSVSMVFDGQVTELPSVVNPLMSSASSASVTTPVPTHSDHQGGTLPPVTNQLMPPHEQSVSGASTMSIHPGNKVTEFPPAVNQQIQPVPYPFGPTHAFMHPSNGSTAVPAVTSQQIQSYSPVPAGLTPVPTGSVNESTGPSTANNQEISSVPPAVNDSMQERHRSRVVPAIESSPVAAKQQQKAESASPMSLASLLQGGQPRSKKKTSQPSEVPAPDAGPAFAAVDPVNSFSDNPPSDSISSYCAPSAEQLNSGLEPKPPQNSSQQIGHQSFDSPRRQDESQNSYERDYNNPNSQEKQRVPDESPYHFPADPHDRRDNYYQHDQRDSYKSHNRRDPYQHEHDSRDLDRPYYDRRESERRNFDRRGEYDRRDSDYSRRSFDNTREYDRWSYDGRDYGRRDSYNNRDSYYDYGYSPRMGRRGYNDGCGSREDVYRGSNQYSGRSTPSSQDRNSPGPYDYSASPYASHQYGYPSYTDSHSMDLYQYQYMMYLYQFHPQHYEQYCQQLGYYSSGYTPEQLAQYYAGYGYESSQPTEQAPEQEVPQPEPERFTPLLYRVQHPLVRFSGGKLVSLIGGEDSERPKTTLASVQMGFSIEETEVIKLFPGPLSSRYSSRTEVMAFCEKRSCGDILTTDGVVKSLVWKVLGNLVKHNGAFVACDLAEVIMENWRSSNDSGKNDFLAPESLPPAEIDSNQHVMVFREMLLAGATKDALEYCMRYRLWGHAMMLSLKLDKKIQVEVSNRFLKTMTDFDPIRTVYDHLSGRQPVALMTPDDWQRSLAAMVANPPRQHPQCIKKNITCLGDTLMSNEQVWAAHLCYLLAGEKFGFPTEDKTKMAVIGIDHRINKIAEQHLPLENLQMMEVLEYAISLSNEEFFIPVLQSFKFVHANKLAEAGFTEEALHYLELIGEMIIKHPTHCNLTLVKNVRELTDRLTIDNQEAADLLEMLDKVLQTKETTSQISSSVTESESEVEEPLAESSASFFSGYDPSTNTPKHQPEQMDEAQHQLSYTETSMSAPSVAQEPPEVEYKQDYWANGMLTGDNQEAFTGDLDAQATQPELPPAFIPKAPEPAPQVPFFVPGPPVAQPLPLQNEQTEAVEEQPVVNGRQWLEESKKVEPLPPKEPDVPKETESAPKPDEKKKKKEPAARNSPMGGWFSGLLSKVIPRGPNQMILPDDNKKSIYWDEDLKRWVNTDEDQQDNAPPPPPPSDMQLGFGRNSMMPYGNTTPATSGTTTHSVGTPSFPGSAAPRQAAAAAAPAAIPGGMATATPPAVSKFSRKAYGGGRLAKKYVDVLNPTGQSSSNGPVMLPNSLLPTFPGPTAAINPATLFVPTPVTDASYDEQAATEPVVANPGSRPSSRNDEDDGADQQSQHSRSSSVSLTSAEVRSYMMPQIPDPPPQSAAAPMFFDPSAFSQPKAQASPRKSRYPGQIRK